jgi:hypothetical protein
MTVNISSLENIIQAKMNALTTGSDSKEVIYLAKALEAIDSGVLTTYALYSSLPTAAASTGRVAYVADTGKIYYSNGSSWVILSTAQDPNFSISTLGVESLETEDYLTINVAVVTSEDWDLITTSPTSTADNFQLSLINPGAQGDIFIDPTWFTFTVYDGVTRAGVKHMAASRNNLDFDNMNASQQGFVHMLKNNNTTIPQGTPTPINFTSTRLIDTRLGSFAGGYFTTNFEGWFKVSFSAWTDGDVYFVLGGSFSALDTTTATAPENWVTATRVVYLQKFETLRLYATTSDAVGSLSTRIVYGSDYNQTNLTQMTLEYLGK